MTMTMACKVKVTLDVADLAAVIEDAAQRYGQELAGVLDWARLDTLLLHGPDDLPERVAALHERLP